MLPLCWIYQLHFLVGSLQEFSCLLIHFGPDAFDTEQLLSSMEKLKHGHAVDIPRYDFKSYKNDVFPARRVIVFPFCKVSILFLLLASIEPLCFWIICQVNPSDVIILEGILIFHDPRVRDFMNMKIFVDTGFFSS